MRKRPLLWTACVFLTGLAYERYQVSFFLLIPVALFLQELQIATRYNTWKIFAGRSVLLLSVFLLGCGHMQKEETLREAYLSKLEDGNLVTVWGEIKSIDTTKYGVRCILTDCYIRIHEEENSWKEDSVLHKQADRLACNDIMVYTSSTHYQVGQIPEIIGQFQHFSTARNQGNFDSRKFYQSQKIDFIVEEQSSRLMGVRQNWIQKWLLELRDNLKQVFETGMSESAAGFYTGMILGDKSNLSETTKDLFAIGGISHILAISGLHVSIIGRRLYMGLRKRRLSFLVAGMIAGSVLLMYCYMVGSSMSTIRAVGMMLLYFLAQYWGRSYDMLNGLGVMCVVLLWENPFLLEYSGFWFSVCALLGIGFVGPALVDNNDRKHRIKVSEPFWMSVGITLATLPVVACSYYEIPIYSSLVNMIALPILAPVFLLGIIGAGIGLWLPGVAHVLFIPCEWLFCFYEWLCRLASTLPGASVICGEPAPVVVIFYYGVLLVGAYRLQGKRTDKKCDNPNEKKTSGNKVILCGICLLFILYPKAKPFEITFLDVGQGDGIYISMGNGTTCFVDGGSTSVNELGKYRILPFLKSKGVTAIDYWFITHADTDHISGVLEVLASGYEVSHLVVAQAAPRDENYMTLVKAAEQSDTKVIAMKAGDQLDTGNVRLSCLYPMDAKDVTYTDKTEKLIETGEESSIGDRNDVSLVLELEVFDAEEVIYRALFTGDISAEVELTLVQQGVFSDVDLYNPLLAI